MDPLQIATIVVGLVGLAGVGLYLGTLVRQSRKRGEADERVHHAEEERDAQARKAAELAKPRSCGRRLLDRLQSLGRP